MSLSHFQATCCGHPSFGEMTGYVTEKESRRDRMETSKTRRSPSTQPPYGGMEFSRTSLQQHKNCITGASFTFCRQAACPRRTASIRPPADRAGDGRTTLNRPAGLKSKPESGRNKPSDHTINPSTQCRNKMKSSQAKTLKTHRSRCPHSWDRCSQPVGNPVPNGWESCSQQPGIPFPDTGTSRLTADAEDDP